MLRRIARSLFAVTAAGVTATTLGFAAAGAASAAGTAPHLIQPPSGGTPVYTNTNCGPVCAMAGYQASGRDFRYVQAVIKVPTTPGNVITSPDLYVGLNDGVLTSTSEPESGAWAGIEPCNSGLGCTNGWEGFYQVFEDGSPGVDVFTVPLTGVVPGDGVFFSIYFNSVGNADRFVIMLPNGDTAGQTVAVHGPVYTSAIAVADWSFTDTSPSPAAQQGKTRVAQFLQGRFTTLNGQQGTFNGPWSLNPVEATTNGFAPPHGTLIAAPAYLWTDANSFKGLWGDAFGVWIYGTGATPTPTLSPPSAPDL